MTKMSLSSLLIVLLALQNVTEAAGAFDAIQKVCNVARQKD
jgi:hypothetical protein